MRRSAPPAPASDGDVYAPLGAFETQLTAPADSVRPLLLRTVAPAVAELRARRLVKAWHFQMRGLPELSGRRLVLALYPVRGRASEAERLFRERLARAAGRHGAALPAVPEPRSRTAVVRDAGGEARLRVGELFLRWDTARAMRLFARRSFGAELHQICLRDTVLIAFALIPGAARRRRALESWLRYFDPLPLAVRREARAQADRLWRADPALRRWLAALVKSGRPAERGAPRSLAPELRRWTRGLRRIARLLERADAAERPAGDPDVLALRVFSHGHLLRLGAANDRELLYLRLLQRALP